MEKLQILIGDALETEDILGISFLWKDLIKCMSEFSFIALVCLFVCRILQLLRFF